VHGIAHSVSARVGAAHGEALATVLPEVMQFNSSVSSDVYASVGNDMNVSADSKTVIAAVRDLSDQIEIRNSLTFHGVKEEMIEDIAEKVIADSVTSNNPIMPSKSEVLGILTSRL
jgi:alcohol dehydrogenase class IV